MFRNISRKVQKCLEMFLDISRPKVADLMAGNGEVLWESFKDICGTAQQGNIVWLEAVAVAVTVGGAAKAVAVAITAAVAATVVAVAGAGAVAGEGAVLSVYRL